MEKHLLLTVTEGAAASYSLRFVNNLFESSNNLRLTLLYIMPRAAGYGSGGKSPVSRSHADSILKNSRNWLRDFAGWDTGSIETKALTAQRGTVREIIEESRRGLYDCTVIGRKAYSWLEEVFNDSVTQTMLWKEIDFPVWICKQPPEHPKKNILLCTNGSAPSLRMADHIGYMLAGHPMHDISVLHIEEKDGPRGSAIEDIFAETRRALNENGITDERISYKSAPETDVTQAILTENNKHNYAAVGLGKRNNAPKKFDTMFPDSLSIRLLRQLQDTALWISK